MGRRALLVIDMLNDFVTPGGALYCGDTARAIIPRVRAAIERFRQAGDPVIFVSDTHRQDDPEFQVWPVHCVRGTEGARVPETIAPAAGDYVIPKRRYSGFFGTDLDLLLRELGVDELVLAGTCTNICVFFTAADARMRNYRVTVLEDAVATFDQTAHEHALRQMKEVLGVRLAPVEAAA